MRSLRTRVAAALGLVLVGLAGACGAGPGDAAAVRAVTVREAGGTVLAQVPLPAGVFAVSYRNSLYGTLAEERYRVHADGRFGLVELAADQLAVLEEYYGVPGPVHAAPTGDRRSWVARPARAPVFTALSIAATELGERTLHVPGHEPVALPPLTSSGPIVVLDVEEVR